MRPLCFLSFLTAALGALGVRPALAANSEPPLVHPIYSKLPDLAEDDFTRRAFAAATSRYKLAPLEIIDVPAAPAPRAPVLLKAAVTKTLKLAFDEALAELTDLVRRDPANAEAHFQRGLLLYTERGELEAALASVEKAIALEPDDAAWRMIHKELLLERAATPDAPGPRP